MAFDVEARDAVSMRVIKGLQDVYRTKVKDVEEAFLFEKFEMEAISDKELEAKSQVLVIGPYSTGKTTFIRYLLGRDFNNMNIGPEPTTDSFTVLVHGDEDRSVAGNSFTRITSLPYSGLLQFGTGFLRRLTASISPSPFLEHITLVDTPGALTGEAHQHRRSYSFPVVARWFADRSDLIVLIFDAHKLDISDELRDVMEGLVEHQDKVRIVLNKADQIERAHLMRVYGALMWTMGTIFPNPEVVRVYVGSFWDRPLKYTAHARLFERDQTALLGELAALPKESATRKMDAIMARVKRLKAHVCVLGHIRAQLPLFRRQAYKDELLEDLARVFEEVRLKHGLHEADLPDVAKFGAVLRALDIADLPALRPATLQQLDDVVDVEFPRVMQEAGGEERVFKYSLPKEPPPDDITRARAAAAAARSRGLLRGVLAVTRAARVLAGGTAAAAVDAVHAGRQQARDGAAAAPAPRKQRRSVATLLLLLPALLTAAIIARLAAALSTGGVDGGRASLTAMIAQGRGGMRAAGRTLGRARILLRRRGAVAAAAGEGVAGDEFALKLEDEDGEFESPGRLEERRGLNGVM